MVILSSPSGAGKTTLVKLLSKNKNFHISISHTTRKPRNNEIADKDYYFIDHDKFESLIKNEEFLEYAKSKIENIDLEDVGLKFEAWKSSDWHTGGEKPRKIKNWKTTLLNTLPHLKKTTAKKTGKLNAYNPNK